MAEYVQQSIEEMVAELHEMRQAGLFDAGELRLVTQLLNGPPKQPPGPMSHFILEKESLDSPFDHQYPVLSNIFPSLIYIIYF